MTRVEMSRWGGGVHEGLTYPECPYMRNYNEEYHDGICTAPCDEGYCGYWCGTRQYAGDNECPFDKE